MCAISIKGLMYQESNTMFVFLPGNAVLLVIYAVMGHDSNKSDRGDLALYNILQIIFTVEFIISVPGILWYLGKLCKYSKHFKTNFSIDLRAWSL